MNIESRLRYAHEQMIEASFDKLRIPLIDTSNISKIISSYSFENKDYGIKYQVIYSGGNSEWSIDDVNVCTFNSYASAENFFMKMLGMKDKTYAELLTRCMHRFRGRVLDSETLSPEDYLYLYLLFEGKTDHHPYSRLRIEIDKHILSISTSLQLKRPVRLIFLPSHPMKAWYRPYKWTKALILAEEKEDMIATLYENDYADVDSYIQNLGLTTGLSYTEQPDNEYEDEYDFDDENNIIDEDA